jgi:hypothetical protein
MKYLQETFTLPVGSKVSQEEWDEIFNEKKEEPISTKDWYAENDDGA